VICNSRLTAVARVHPSVQRSFCRLNGNEFSASRSWCNARLNGESTLAKARLIAAFGQSNGDDLGIGAADVPSSSGRKGDDEAPVRSVNWRQFLEEAARLVRKNVWVLLMIHFTCDALVFVLHRLSHRLTNERK
jgi:hypothetical protein